MAFRVGQKVVCIAPGDFKVERSLGHQVPVRGAVYTVRDVTAHGGKLGIRLREIINPPHKYIEGFAENAWLQEEFRPLIERKANMEARNALFRKWEKTKDTKIVIPIDEQV